MLALAASGQSNYWHNYCTEQIASIDRALAPASITTNLDFPYSHEPLNTNIELEIRWQSRDEILAQKHRYEQFLRGELGEWDGLGAPFRCQGLVRHPDGSTIYWISYGGAVMSHRQSMDIKGTDAPKTLESLIAECRTEAITDNVHTTACRVEIYQMNVSTAHGEHFYIKDDTPFEEYLKALKDRKRELSQQSGPAYPPQGVGSADP